MKRKLIIFFFIAIAVLSCITLIYYQKLSKKHETVASVHKLTIKVGSNEELYFFSNGFAIVGDQTTFYDFSGKLINPFSSIDNDLISKQKVDITVSSRNYMIINGKYLFDTSTIPFKKVLEITEGTGWNLKECRDFILLIVNSNDVLKTRIVKKDGTLLNLDIPEPLNFIDADYFPDDGREISILTLDCTTPYPVTRVFHYSNTRPYGALSINDQCFYRIYRLESHIILVGIHEILCYNVDGTLKWKLKIPGIINYPEAHTDSGVFLYLKNTRIGDGSNANAIFIKNNGEYLPVSLPDSIFIIKPFRNGIAGVDYNNNIFFFEPGEKIREKKNIGIDVRDFYIIDHTSACVVSKSGEIFILEV